MLKPGDRDAYTVRVFGETEAESSQAQYVFEVGKLVPAKHAARVEVTRSVQQGMGEGASRPFKGKTVGLLDDHNRFEASQTEPAVAGLVSPGESPASNMLLELPANPVRIGDSWNFKLLGAAGLGVPDMNVKATLLGPGQIHGHAVWRVKFESTSPFSMDLKKMILMAERTRPQKREFEEKLKGVSMTMSGTMTYSGVGLLDQQSGKTVTMRAVSTEDAVVSIVLSRKEIPSGKKARSGKTEMTLVLNGY